MVTASHTFNLSLMIPSVISAMYAESGYVLISLYIFCATMFYGAFSDFHQNEED